MLVLRGCSPPGLRGCCHDVMPSKPGLLGRGIYDVGQATYL